jgi:hypothetical protein
MELDGYCEELKIAFEHQGIQHYKHVKHFGSTDEIQSRDKLKRILCKNKGIELIEIPALFHLTSLDDLHTVVGKQITINFDKSKLLPVEEVLNINSVRFIEYDKELEKIKNKIKQRGGTLYTEIYSGWKCILELACENGHKWETPASSIKNGRWCPVCANKTSITIDQVKSFAKNYNVECLSDTYIKNSLYMSWRCLNSECEYKWLSTYNNFQARKGCPKCNRTQGAKKRKTGIEAYQAAAKTKGGKCLSATINSCYDKLEFECGFGHKWFGRADQVKNTKQWCPECFKNKRRKK